jgi:hypothetical protein
MSRTIRIVDGRVVSDTGPEPELADDFVPIAERPQRANPLPLGDYTEQLLASVGITKDRYAAAKEALGLPPTCGCASRQAWLNRAGAWLAGLAQKQSTDQSGDPDHG